MEQTNMTQDEKYMKQAIKQAKKAYALDEVPIGCVIVAGDKIIGAGSSYPAFIRGLYFHNNWKDHRIALHALP